MRNSKRNMNGLKEEVQDELLAHLKLLERFGPQLGRPHVDTLKGSRFTNMKELRFSSKDGVWRFAFAFDPKRQAIVLCGGDKSGGGERRFYRDLIRKADGRFSDQPRSHKASERKERKTAMRTLKDKLNNLNPQRREKVEARAAQLIAEEMTRRELRRARKLTQVHLAKALGITQDGVSRLEKRTDLLLSTLREYVEAMGGKLSLIAEFRDREPVLLSGIAEEDEPRTLSKRVSQSDRKSVVIKAQKSR